MDEDEDDEDWSEEEEDDENDREQRSPREYKGSEGLIVPAGQGQQRPARVSDRVLPCALTGRTPRWGGSYAVGHHRGAGSAFQSAKKEVYGAPCMGE